MEEEEIRDYLLGLSEPKRHAEINRLIETDSVLRQQVEDVALFVELSRRMMREKLKHELNEIKKNIPPDKPFNPLLLLGLILPLLGGLVYFFFFRSQDEAKETILSAPVSNSAVVDTISKTDTIKEVKNLSAEAPKKNSFPVELPIITTVTIKIKSQEKGKEVIEGQAVSIRFIKTKGVSPEYRFEKDLNTGQYQFVLKGDFSESDVKKAQMIDLKNSQAPYKHVRVGKNFYVINETQGTYVKFKEETNPVVQKELKSFWQKTLTFFKNIFKKKD